jgi:uncharacterized protein (TIGR03546 family)
MYRWLINKLLLVRKMLPGGDSPRQLACGLALGLLLGLIPKGNLTAVVISLLIFGSTVNLGTALLTAAAVSAGAVYLDPFTHRIGQTVLTHPTLQPHWTRFYEMPVVPWTDLNNTVVAGSFLLGVTLLYPAYLLSRPVFQRYWVKSAKVTSQTAATATPTPQSANAPGEVRPASLPLDDVNHAHVETPVVVRKAA